MNKLTKQNQEQNYLIFSEEQLKKLFEQIYSDVFGSQSAQNKDILSGQADKVLKLNFSDWNEPKKRGQLLIEEYLWGIRLGVSQYLDVERCSFSEVLEIAKHDEMCEIYSPAKVQYFSDGSRKVVSHNISVFNTDFKFSGWTLIDIEQAKDLFPRYINVFNVLPKRFLFLCSPKADLLRIASQGDGEIGFSFFNVDADIKEVGFYLGNLRLMFKDIAQEIKLERGQKFCDSSKTYNLDYLKSKICLMSGGKYPYYLAQNLASEKACQTVKDTYLRQGINNKRDFSILIDGSYIADDDNFNCFINEDGQDIKICVPPLVYEQWGSAFSADELEIIKRGYSFNFKSHTKNDYFCKINRLRFSNREICIFAQARPQEMIIEVKKLQQIITARLKEIEQEDQKLLKEISEVNQRTKNEFLAQEKERQLLVEERRKRDEISYREECIRKEEERLQREKEEKRKERIEKKVRELAEFKSELYGGEPEDYIESLENKNEDELDKIRGKEILRALKLKAKHDLAYALDHALRREEPEKPKPRINLGPPCPC